MKILWLSHLMPFPPKGGVMQRSYGLIREISKYHCVEMVAFNQKSIIKTKHELEIAKNHFNNFCYVLNTLPIKYDYSKSAKYALLLKSLFKKDPYSINWLKTKTMELTIKNNLNKNTFDLVHFDTISLAPYIHLFKEHKRVLNHHNIESQMMLRRSRNEKNPVKKFYYYQEGIKLKSYEKKVCKLFQLNIVCSELDKKRLQKTNPSLNVQVVPNGVDLEYFKPKKHELENNSLLFVGGMNWYPNKRAMIFFTDSVWPLLKKEIAGITMTIVGNEPPEKLVKLSKSDQNFKVTGFVDDVRPYMNKKMVYICPIKDGGGTKLKILDALAMKKAIVADPIACEGINVINGESVLFAKNPDQYVAKIKQLLHNKELMIKLGNNGRNLIINCYDFVKIGKILKTFYELI